MRALLVCLLLFARPALGHGAWDVAPGSVCRPAAPMPAAEARRVQDGEGPPPLRRAMLSCLRDGAGPRKRPLRWT